MDLSAQTVRFRQALKAEMPAYGVQLSREALDGLSQYYRILIVWNPRLHLVSFQSPKEFATRHVLESLLLLKYLPQGAFIADVGSGGGLPGIPCLIARSDLHAVLVEASKKKALFLREALRETGAKERAHVIAERFEKVATPEVDFVTCRALEKFESMLPSLLKWAPAQSTMLLFGGEGLSTALEALGLAPERVLLSNSTQRFLFILKNAGQALL